MDASPPPRPWFERKRFVIPMAAAAIVGGLVLAGTDSGADPAGTLEGATSLPASTAHPAVRDVRLVRCGPDAADHWTPHVEVTNHSSEPAAYVVGFDVERRSGRKVGEAAVVVERVGPGRTVEQVGTSEVAGDDLFCRATSVIRVAAD
jgi:hypothetical protein